jgi:Uma2 family endonuclease
VRFRPQPGGRDMTVLEPDVVVVKNTSIVRENGIAGVPDMLAEILSPSTAQYDRTIKYELYERAGVKEYWIVDTDKKIAEVFILHDGLYTEKKTYREHETAALTVLPDCKIDL